MNVKDLKKEMSVYDLSILMMAGFDRMEQRMATREDLAGLKKELKRDIAELRKDIKDTNKRIDSLKLYIPSLI